MSGEEVVFALQLWVVVCVIWLSVIYLVRRLSR